MLRYRDIAELKWGEGSLNAKKFKSEVPVFNR
jgi:hypothetical protein